MNLAESLEGTLPGINPGIYRPEDFEQISKIVHEGAGIVLPPAKAMLAYSRLAPLVRSTNSGTFAAYITLLRRDETARRQAIEALTTNHTFFYREEHHFAHFAAAVRPLLIDRLKAGEPVRLWSAGSSSGEELWSLLMTLLGPDRQEGLRIAGRDLVVLASDLARHVLKKAESATYATGDIAAVPAELRKAWTTEAGDSTRINDELLRLVRFRQLNLLEAWPLKRPFDVIFCRNVMIYFDDHDKERLVARFTEQLKPGGYLYIGHSERACGPAEAQLNLIGPTIYQRRTP